MLFFFFLGRFNILNVGEVSVIDILDYEIVMLYYLVIIVIDGGVFFLLIEVFVMIFVFFVNEYVLVFVSSGSYLVLVFEDIDFGMEFICVMVNDGDDLSYVYGRVIYFIIFGDIGFFFFIFVDSGVI